MPAIVSNKTSCTHDIVTNPFCLIVLQILLAVLKFLRTSKDTNAAIEGLSEN